MRGASWALAVLLLLGGLLLGRETKACLKGGECVVVSAGGKPLFEELGVVKTTELNVDREQTPPPTEHGDLDCGGGCKTRIGMALIAPGPIIEARYLRCDGACSHVWPCPNGGKCNQDVLYDLTREEDGTKRCGGGDSPRCRLWVLARNYGDRHVHAVSVKYIDAARRRMVVLATTGSLIAGGIFAVWAALAKPSRRKR